MTSSPASSPDHDDGDRNEALRSRQLAREYEAHTLASQKVNADWQKAQNTGDPLRSPSTRTLANHWTSPLAAYITAEADNVKHSTGPRPRWLKKASRFLDAETLAHVTIRTILSILISERRVKLSKSGKLPKPLTSSRLAGDMAWRSRRLHASQHSASLIPLCLLPSTKARTNKGPRRSTKTPS